MGAMKFGEQKRGLYLGVLEEGEKYNKSIAYKMVFKRKKKGIVCDIYKIKALLFL